MRSLALLAAATVLGITSVAATESLPLERGYYVESDTPCEQASNATITLYDGATFGSAHAECRKPKIQRLADGSYQISERCRDLQGRGGSWETFKSRYAVQSRTEFVETTAFGTFSFRYCKQSDLPEPWSKSDLSASGTK
jgi:hypothetical protein